MIYRLIPNTVEANKITEVRENETTDLQDYDLVLENGQEVVLHKENCGGKQPQVGDYFMICHRSHVYLYPAEVFKASYELVEETGDTNQEQ